MVTKASTATKKPIPVSLLELPIKLHRTINNGNSSKKDEPIVYQDKDGDIRVHIYSWFTGVIVPLAIPIIGSLGIIGHAIITSRKG